MCCNITDILWFLLLECRCKSCSKYWKYCLQETLLLIRKVRHHPLDNWNIRTSPDSDFYPWKFRCSKTIDNRLDPTLSSRTPLFPIAYLSEFHIKIIGNHEDVSLRIELIKVYDTRDRLSREIHVCLRLEKNDFFSVEHTLADDSLKPR